MESKGNKILFNSLEKETCLHTCKQNMSNLIDFVIIINELNKKIISAKVVTSVESKHIFTIYVLCLFLLFFKKIY